MLFGRAEARQLKVKRTTHEESAQNERAAKTSTRTVRHDRVSERESKSESKQRLPLSREFLCSLCLSRVIARRTGVVDRAATVRTKETVILSLSAVAVVVVLSLSPCVALENLGGPACQQHLSLSRRRGSVLAGLVNNGRFFPPLFSLSVFTAPASVR